MTKSSIRGSFALRRESSKAAASITERKVICSMSVKGCVMTNNPKASAAVMTAPVRLFLAQGASFFPAGESSPVSRATAEKNVRPPAVRCFESVAAPRVRPVSEEKDASSVRGLRINNDAAAASVLRMASDVVLTAENSKGDRAKNRCQVGFSSGTKHRRSVRRTDSPADRGRRCWATVFKR